MHRAKTERERSRTTRGSGSKAPRAKILEAWSGPVTVAPASRVVVTSTAWDVVDRQNQGSHLGDTVHTLALTLFLSTTFASLPQGDEYDRLIQPEFFKGHLYYLASDTLAGRDTPSEGLDLAADYIRAHLQKWGYQGVAEGGSYFQRIEMVRQSPDPDAHILVKVGDRDVRLDGGKHWTGTGDDLKGELVFAGFGLSSETADYDDYENLDVQGKVVVVLPGYPPGFSSRDFRIGERSMPSTTLKLRFATEKGATGILLLTNWKAPSSRRPSRARTSFKFLTNPSAGSAPRVPMIRVYEEGTAVLSEAFGVDFLATEKQVEETKKSPSRPLGGSAELVTTGGEQSLWTQNVVGFLPGTDPVLSKEIVAFSAHYDHVGQRGQGEDSIFNGADDDGSGTAACLVLAEAFSKVKDRRRSIMFIWHCGEEKGLRGAQYYTQYPLKPLEDMACLLNIDMIGRNFQDDPANADHVYLVGARKISTEMDTVIRAMNEKGPKMRLDDSDPASYYTRSDHYMYARAGVPIAFFCTGEHSDYHQVGDHPDKILYDKMSRITSLVFRTGLEFVNRDERPVKDVKDSRGR